jgi:phosphopantetheinyl transferase (holo-ACP synthase)
MKISIERSRAINPNDTNEELFRKELERHERVINSKFSNTEKNYIYNRPNIVESLTAFYRLWCLKEAYVKALGDGVGFDLKRIECSPNSELLIDLNGKKHVVVNDTQLFVDSKLVKTCKYYEQYYMNNLTSNESTSGEHKHELHIMTLCILEKESSLKSSKDKPSSSSTSTNNNTSTIQSSSETDEFVEIALKDLISSITPLQDLEECLNSDEFEDLWQRFCQKLEEP